MSACRRGPCRTGAVLGRDREEPRLLAMGCRRWGADRAALVFTCSIFSIFRISFPALHFGCSIWFYVFSIFRISLALIVSQARLEDGVDRSRVPLVCVLSTGCVAAVTSTVDTSRMAPLKRYARVSALAAIPVVGPPGWERSQWAERPAPVLV